MLPMAGQQTLAEPRLKITPRRCTPTHPNQCTYKVSNFCALQFPRYSPGKILSVKVTMARSKVKSRSRCTIQPQDNVPTNQQLPTPYDFRDIAWTRFYRSRSLWQGQTRGSLAKKKDNVFA